MIQPLPEPGDAIVIWQLLESAVYVPFEGKLSKPTKTTESRYFVFTDFSFIR